ncbi:transglutaminase [bacterium]|nr:transglutaminase [bacterium]
MAGSITRTWIQLLIGCLVACKPWFVYAQGSLVNETMLLQLEQEYGVAARERGLDLRAALELAKSKPEQEKLLLVNDFFNDFLYREDLAQWGEQDYWATPQEFVGRYGGDCEDYVIAKYFALISIGVNGKKLYLTYVKALEFDVSHMVLTYFEAPNQVPLVLDNYNRRILKATERRDLIPVYSFNAESLFLTNPSAGLAQRLPTDKVKNSKWDRLLKTIEGEFK